MSSGANKAGNIRAVVAATKHLLLRPTFYPQALIEQDHFGIIVVLVAEKAALIAMTVIKQRCA